VRVHVDLGAAPPRVTLLDAGVFTAFDAVIEGGAPEPGALAAAGLPRSGPGHVWVPIALLRELAGDARTPAWDEQLDAMVAYAAGKGWLDEDLGAVRAHVAA
jgi:hypothetical protein